MKGKGKVKKRRKKETKAKTTKEKKGRGTEKINILLSLCSIFSFFPFFFPDQEGLLEGLAVGLGLRLEPEQPLCQARDADAHERLARVRGFEDAEQVGARTRHVRELPGRHAGARKHALRVLMQVKASSLKFLIIKKH